MSSLWTLLATTMIPISWTLFFIYGAKMMSVIEVFELLFNAFLFISVPIISIAIQVNYHIFHVMSIPIGFLIYTLSSMCGMFVKGMLTPRPGYYNSPFRRVRISGLNAPTPGTTIIVIIAQIAFLCIFGLFSCII